jgi:hypothetical protein
MNEKSSVPGNSVTSGLPISDWDRVYVVTHGSECLSLGIWCTMRKLGRDLQIGKSPSPFEAIVQSCPYLSNPCEFRVLDSTGIF